MAKNTRFAGLDVHAETNAQARRAMGDALHPHTGEKDGTVQGHDEARPAAINGLMGSSEAIGSHR